MKDEKGPSARTFAQQRNFCSACARVMYLRDEKIRQPELCSAERLLLSLREGNRPM